jgi:hypothetical protein
MVIDFPLLEISPGSASIELASSAFRRRWAREKDYRDA